MGEQRKRALAILVDGCRPDALLCAEAPALKKLALQGGAFSFHVDCGPIPLSAPSWATILTGTSVVQHGLETNDVYQISRDKASEKLVCKPIKTCVCGESARKPRCAIYRRGVREKKVHFPESVFARLAIEGKQSALVMQGWNGIGVIVGGSALSEQRPAEVLQEGSVSNQFFPPDYPAMEGVDSSVAATKKLIQEVDGPDLVSIFLHITDKAGHLYGFGPDVPEYLDAIRKVDMAVAQLLHAIDQQEEDWLVAVTTDHGGTQAYLPAEMREEFLACGCLQHGISQEAYLGVHGIVGLRQHTQVFQIYARAKNLKPGEILPAPEPVDLVPTVFHHLVGKRVTGLVGKVHGIMVSTEAEEPPAKKHRGLETV